jgi:hypothetical protein
MQVDFQYDAEEGSLRMSLWKLVNPVYRFLTVGGTAPEEIMYCGRYLNTARYYSSYRDGWQESTSGTQYSCYPQAFFLRTACGRHFAMLTGHTRLRGVWIFQYETVPTYGQDLRYDAGLSSVWTSDGHGRGHIGHPGPI